ncbi:MAG: thioesterase family protein [Aestuariivita sp.]|nr:thioesterase family protein [Aestuariivita sp.]MCY4203351.1 thioesterase family protein [Aestuariivita sp.]MCY4287641.1 thioesterase family protein [Aestuariivita sp.]MCY4346548.1 thioesterase family protein [Aestuariivita sp.]
MATRAKPGTRSDYADFYPLQTRWIDNDTYGHVNNAVAYSLFDTAVNGWLLDRGLFNPRTSEEYGIVAETGCRYFAEMTFPDRITAGLRISHVGNSSVRYEVALFRNEDEAAACEGFFVHVYVRRKDHKPVSIASAHRAAFERLLVR